MRNPALSLVPILLLASCAKPFVKVSPDYSAEPLKPALLAAAAASFDSDDDSEGVAIMDTVMNARLPEFGEKMIERVTPFLAERGFELSFDHDRVATADQSKMEGLANFTSVAGGAWFSPQASMYVLDHNTWGRGPVYERILGLAAPMGDDEHLVFIDATVYGRHRYLVVGYSLLVLDIIVVDGQGNEQWLARGVGEGPSSAFVALHHVEALTEALEDALATIEVAVPEVLEE